MGSEDVETQALLTHAQPAILRQRLRLVSASHADWRARRRSKGFPADASFSPGEEVAAAPPHTQASSVQHDLFTSSEQYPMLSTAGLAVGDGDGGVVGSFVGRAVGAGVTGGFVGGGASGMHVLLEPIHWHPLERHDLLEPNDEQT